MHNLRIYVFFQHDLTLDVVILFVAAVIFFITSVFFVMLQLLAGLKIAFFIYSTIIIITVLMVSFKNCYWFEFFTIQHYDYYTHFFAILSVPHVPCANYKWLPLRGNASK